MGGAGYKAEIRVGDRGVLMKNWGKNYGGMGVKIRILNMIMKETHWGDKGGHHIFQKKIWGDEGGQLACYPPPP